ncbi:ATP-dependent helicase [Betaproteobacteria bacterium PRO7]|jgi:DNA helicase-2/ATP-dependent DNA helicase PcrA|nr:ATP-dependent helicase [Betaproteobacteria bacterium PRO7]
MNARAESFDAARERWLSTLNPQQRAAAEFGADAAAAGPLLVIAGAGSGKTNTLAHRVACLIERGADPRAILLLTFSRRAAVEMTRRVDRIVAATARARGRSAAVEIPWAGTFHAIGARLLREYAGRIGLAPAFTIHDREDSADLMNLVRHELGLSKTEKRFPLKGTCLAIYSRAVNTEQPLGEVLAQWFPWCAEWEAQLRGLFAAYVDAKQRQGVLDYDDLLLYWSATMAEPALADEIRARFSHVLVDEYQDTNRLQASILHALKPDGDGLTVVGDDAQSIYSFRGATVRNIFDFPRAFDRPATVITLERNYRSTQPILAASNAVIALARERYTKNLHSERPSSLRPRLVSVADEAAQARYVAEQVLEGRERGLALRAQAVLFRASQHSMQLELELGRRNIPFVKFGGLKFLEAAHVKDLLACLRWAANPRDRVSGFRVLLMVPGVGPKTAARALDRLAEASDPVAALDGFEAPAATRDDWCALAGLARALRERTAAWPAELALVRRWYEPQLQRLYEDAEVRAADLAALEHIAGTYPSRERFLTELTLDPPDATSGEAGAPLRDEDYLTLSTIHSAKGQEWGAVYVLNAVDGCIPSDLATGTPAEIEEERRLLYVAMTRAKDALHVIVPQRFYVTQQSAGGDRHVYATRTRFIPNELTTLFEPVAWPAAEQCAARAPTAAVPIDLAAKLRGMWR